MGGVTDARVEPDELMARARALVPAFRERAEQAERGRRIPDETIAEMREAGLFRVLQPARFGGFEHDFGLFVRISCEIARACASSAWVGGLAMTHQWLIANFPAQTQDDVWAEDPGAITFGSYAPAATAVAVDGGFRISGSWPFASGCDHGQWGLLGVFFPADGSDDARQPGFVLVPAADYSIDDDWYTVGLAATGSKRIVCDNVFVPAHRRLTFAELASGQAPGREVNPNPLYGIPILAVLPATIAAPAIGALQGAIDDFIDATKARKTRGAVVLGGHSMAGFAGVQSKLAAACIARDAANLLLTRDIAETQALAAAGKEISVDIRIRNRLTQSYVVKLAVDAIDGLYSVCGGAGLYLDNRLQRSWRDIIAIAHHVSLNWDAVSTMYGQHRLGLEPQGQY